MPPAYHHSLDFGECSIASRRSRAQTLLDTAVPGQLLSADERGHLYNAFLWRRTHDIAESLGIRLPPLTLALEIGHTPVCLYWSDLHRGERPYTENDARFLRALLSVGGFSVTTPLPPPPKRSPPLLLEIK